MLKLLFSVPYFLLPTPYSLFIVPFAIVAIIRSSPGLTVPLRVLFMLKIINVKLF
ncbi:MAG: hypothetical protein F6K55_21415 [Moorea sp. SIO4A3]|nr:hypothetical protein [Moorena sp. SIO4A3]